MKKSLVLLTFAMIFATASQAQLKFGLKGGPNVTNLSLKDFTHDRSNQCGFFAGPTVKFTFPAIGLGFDVAALYDQRQAKIKGTEDDLKQRQMIVPVNTRYSFGLGDAASIFFFAGPQFGFNIGDKDQPIGVMADGRYENVGEWRLKSSNFSVNLGFGVMLFHHLQVSANYNIACGKTGELKFGEAAGTVWNALQGNSYEGRANAWQVGLAYYF